MSQERPKRPSSFAALAGVWLALMSGLLTAAGLFGGKKRSSGKRRGRGSNQVVLDPRVARAMEVTQRALMDARERVDLKEAQTLLDDLAQRAGTMVQTKRAELSQRPTDFSELAKDVVERIRTEGAQLTSDMGERIRADVAPVAKEWAQEAIDEAEQILAAARERAGDLSDTTREEYLPRVSSTAGAAGGLVAGTAVSAAQALGKRIGEAGAKPAGKSAKRSRGRGKPSGPTLMQRAGHQSKYVVGETLMIVFWSSVLGTVVYYGLLTEEKRRKVRDFLSSAVSQVQDLFSEYQSTEEFPREQAM